MNIDFIKSEIAKLSQLVASWSDDANISAIERDMALDKLKALYEHLRFGIEPIATEDTHDTLPVAEAELPESEEKDVEVEFLFAEEDDDEPTELDAPVESESEEEVVLYEAPEEEDDASITEESPAEPVIVSEPVAEETNKETSHNEDVTKTTPEEPQSPSIGNLFGTEEPKRHSRSKHIRMMSIYDNDESSVATTSKEKDIDISKIFDFGVNLEPSEKNNDIATPTVTDSNETGRTLADAIAPNTTTLADTIASPAPLGEEIHNSKIESLTDGVGINDKFLMIRDLFGGNESAYEKAIRDLDREESFDDCMIYIAENFEWNPDSEGARFIMKLLERKHA